MQRWPQMRGTNLKTCLIDTLPGTAIRQLIAGLSDFEAEIILREWDFWARANQIEPSGNWRTWLIMAGRGFGKTRTGAEWIRAQVKAGAGFIGLIAPTAADARDIMVEGESGLLSVCWKGDVANNGDPLGRPKFQSSRRRVQWANGATAMMFSAEEPERLRGPQHEVIWADEFAAWRNGKKTWDTATFGLRLGTNPRACVTTTPKPVPALRELINDRGTIVTKGSSTENSAHLAASFLKSIEAKYGGSILGRQELDGELIEEVVGAIWKRAEIEAQRVKTTPDLRRIVVAVDPPTTSNVSSDACGIVVAACDADGHAYVLADHTISAAAPREWAARVIGAFHAHHADLIVAEVNQGGEMVSSVLGTVDPNVPIKTVHANRGKFLRAEPVAALYAKGVVHHVGPLPDLEDELCSFTVNGLPNKRSPDRLDALVWSIHTLLLGNNAVPRVRSFV